MQESSLGMVQLQRLITVRYALLIFRRGEVGVTSSTVRVEYSIFTYRYFDSFGIAILYQLSF